LLELLIRDAHSNNAKHKLVILIISKRHVPFPWRQTATDRLVPRSTAEGARPILRAEWNTAKLLNAFAVLFPSPFFQTLVFLLWLFAVKTNVLCEMYSGTGHDVGFRVRKVRAFSGI